MKYYVKFSNDFGDIIKNTFTRARDISKIHTAKTMAYSLMAVYKDCIATKDTAQEAAGNDETVATDLSPLRVRRICKRYVGMSFFGNGRNWLDDLICHLGWIWPNNEKL